MISRKDAISQNLTRYNGKVCKKHLDINGLRYVLSYGCIACSLKSVQKNQAKIPNIVKQRNAEYRSKHKDKLKENYRLWAEKNKIALSEKKRKHREVNILRIKEKYKEYYLKNYPKMLAKRNKQHADKLQRTPTWLKNDELWMIEEAYELAGLRTKMFGFAWHVDHVLPLRGKTISGLHTPYNLQVIPAKENLQKGNRVNHG
jgi:hypothetical protein